MFRSITATVVIPLLNPIICISNFSNCCEKNTREEKIKAKALVLTHNLRRCSLSWDGRHDMGHTGDSG